MPNLSVVVPLLPALKLEVYLGNVGGGGCLMDDVLTVAESAVFSALELFRRELVLYRKDELDVVRVVRVEVLRPFV